MAENDETPVSERLNRLLVDAGLDPLSDGQVRSFEAYLSLLLRWNARTNLTAVRDPLGILSRHFVECIACARALPAGICSLLDFGSGAGLPGVPIALCRPEIAVTLAESQGKKAAFLQEAIRTLSLSVCVHSGRAEALSQTFDCVTLRAVEKMAASVRAASGLVAASGWLALMGTQGDLPVLQLAAGAAFSWSEPIALPGGKTRILALGRRGK